MDQQSNKLKADLLAGEILRLAHATLLVHLRFMEGALCRLRFEPMPKGTIWTDGQRFSYAPRHVLVRYRTEREAPARDYAAFLRKFAVRAEVLHIDPAEFDYIYYTYGLRLYGRMPLIEPLEYREDLRIRSFVVAIDTSASVSEELVHAFLQKTFNILKASESFFSRVEIRILQCDTQVQDDVRITNLQELDKAIQGLPLRGFGGTDFRPVFQYVDELRRRGELQGLKGLLYFTDGMGTYPQQKPDYDVAFVFLENEGSQYEVPVWAMKLTLEPEEILEDV